MKNEERDSILKKYRKVLSDTEREVVFSAVRKEVLRNLFLEFRCAECGGALHAVPDPDFSRSWEDQSVCHVLACPVCQAETVIAIAGEKKNTTVVSRRRLIEMARRATGKPFVCPEHGNDVEIRSIRLDTERPWHACLTCTPCKYEKMQLWGGKKHLQHTSIWIDLLEYEADLSR